MPPNSRSLGGPTVWGIIRESEIVPQSRIRETQIRHHSRKVTSYRVTRGERHDLPGVIYGSAWARDRLPPKPDKICRRDINSRIESLDEMRARGRRARLG